MDSKEKITILDKVSELKKKKHQTLIEDYYSKSDDEIKYFSNSSQKNLQIDDECQSDGYFYAQNPSLSINRHQKFLSIDYTKECSRFLSSKDEPHNFDLQLIERSYTIYNILAHNIVLKKAFNSQEVEQFFKHCAFFNEQQGSLLKKAKRKSPKLTLQEKKSLRIEEILQENPFITVTNVTNMTGFHKNFVKKIMTRISKHGKNVTQQRGPISKISDKMLNFLEQIFLQKPDSTFKMAYKVMLDVFNLEESYISIQQVREVFKKSKNFTRKRIVPIKIRAITNHNLNQRKRFVQQILPFISDENQNKIEIWYIDECGFNLEGHVNYGWARKGFVPIVKVPIKSPNISLLLGISKNKTVYYQFFLGGIKGNDFRGYMIGLIQARNYHQSIKGKKKQRGLFILDNAKIHHAKDNQLLLTHRYNFLYLPPYSSPLNPIELVFAYLKKRIYKQTYLTQHALIVSVSQEIRKMPLKVINNIINHNINMLKRAWRKDKLKQHDRN